MSENVKVIIIRGCQRSRKYSPRLFINEPGLPEHYACVYVDGIGWILNSSGHIFPKHLLEPHDIALGTIRDKNLRKTNVACALGGGGGKEGVRQISGS